MATTTSTIIGVFDDTATAQRVADELRQRGISSSNIDVTSGSAYASDAARGGTGLSGDRPHDKSGGGITGFFKRLFGTDDTSDERGHYAEALRRGGALVAVRASEDEQDLVSDVMDQYDPVDIDHRAANWRERGYSGYDPSAPVMNSDEIAREREYYGDVSRGDALHGDAERRIPVAQEEVEIDKRSVRRGGVRVYRNVHEEPVEQQVNLREERVRVDRRPADRPATEDDFRNVDDVVEFTETVEEPVVRKQSRVVEEVVVGKETHNRTETVHDTVRRTDVDVEQFGREGSGYDDNDFRRDFETRYASERGASYDTYAPAYRYGSEMANDARYRGRNWDDVEDTLKTDYLRTHPTSTWDRMRGAVRYGWEKVTNKRP